MPGCPQVSESERPQEPQAPLLVLGMRKYGEGGSCSSQTQAGLSRRGLRSWGWLAPLEGVPRMGVDGGSAAQGRGWGCHPGRWWEHGQGWVVDKARS